MSDFQRVYFVLDAAAMDALDSAKQLSGNEIAGFGLTDALRAAASGEDSEGLEYLALQECATDAASRGLRVVAAADVPAASVRPAPDPASDASVVITGPIPLRRMASLHLLDPAGDRDPDDDLELSWYDITELAEVRALSS